MGSPLYLCRSIAYSARTRKWRQQSSTIHSGNVYFISFVLHLNLQYMWSCCSESIKLFVDYPAFWLINNRCSQSLSSVHASSQWTSSCWEEKCEPSSYISIYTFYSMYYWLPQNIFWFYVCKVCFQHENICFSSFFQSLCVIGYCLLPPTLSALTCVTLLRFSFFLRLALTAAAFVWATYSGMYSLFFLLKYIRVNNWLRTEHDCISYVGIFWVKLFTCWKC